MVMHARKPLKRISDGYFEKHQAHPYQKYNSKSDRRPTADYGPSDSRYTPLRSPNGNVAAQGHGAHTGPSSHSHHHYGHLPDDRGYAVPRNAYPQKSAEKERDRDYKSSRNKYTESVRSPKERTKEIERERTNHERNESREEKKNSRSSGLNVGVSRSSKYDKRSAPGTSVPPGHEWSEHISSHGKVYYYNCLTEVSQWDKPRDFDLRRTAPKDSSYASRSNREKRSRSRSDRREAEKNTKRSNNTDRYWTSGRDEEFHDRTRPKHAAGTHDGKEGQSTQDMDISPDRSTPISENSYNARELATGAASRAMDGTAPPVVVLDNSNQPSGSLLAAALPRMVSGAAGVATTSGANNGGATPTQAEAPGGGAGGDTPRRDPGPPTPTHSENIDPHAPPLHLDAALPRKMECLGSYSSVVGGPLQHAAPMLTPSLHNYVRADLTAHGTGWPADILEKQANKFTEEAYQLGCLQCTRVSAELKCSRSVVRQTEIQATLQEQKLMYLRQQISRLEELKSQNSFMSED